MSSSAKSGAIVGVVVATIYSTVLGLLLLVGGRGAFDEGGLNPVQLIAAYYAVGGAGGFVAGYLGRFATNRLVATGIGVLVAGIAMFGIIMSIEGNPLKWREYSGRDWRFSHSSSEPY